MALLNYRECSTIGDIVMIENNSVVGIVTSKEILMGGHVMHLQIYPFTNFLYRWYLALRGKLDFYEGQIDDSRCVNPIRMIREKVYQM